MAQPIAIVGILVELPSGAYSNTNLDHASFFKFLLEKGQAYEDVPSDRFNIEAWKGDSLGQIHVQKGCFLKYIDLFDNVEFGISSCDARAMAPVTKKLLENYFLALLDSGIDYRKKRVGCYTSGNCIELSTVSNSDKYEPRGSFAGYPSMIANRVSNHLDLLGPSVPVDTACSSSLTALHLAVQAILLGDCQAAVVGGCQLNHRLIDWISYSQSSILSNDGKCKPFELSLFSRAEGCVAIVIKPLKDALRDHDHIYATILGTSINSTGSGGPPGAPVAESQHEAMVDAFQRACRLPQDVAYVELHATGTAKGDPTEANWVGEHFRRSSELLIGSVKGNIGHTEISAFLASLSKVISIFTHNVIPPNVNIERLNPAIKWHDYNLRAPTSPTTLQPVSGKTLLSMASSGIGGFNGHVVLEAPPLACASNCRCKLPQHPNGPVLFMAAGLSPRSASTIADQLSYVLRKALPASEHAALPTVLGRRSKQMNWRSYAVASMVPQTPLQFSSPQFSARDTNPVVFVFSGQGPQYEGMGRELFAYPGTGSTAWPISLTLPTMAMFQIALFDLFIHLGVRPDIVLGHSTGETPLLYASGAASKQMSMELAIIRGQGDGTMAVLSCSPEHAQRLLEQYKVSNPTSVVELACFNSPSGAAIAGQDLAIDGVLDLARSAGTFGRKIRTRVPFHSSMMEACQDRYLEQVRDLFARHAGSYVPKIPTYSTLTGELFRGPFTADYFWENTRYEVRFAQTIKTLHGPSSFIEISPHPVLSSYLSDMVQSPVLSPVHRPKKGSIRSTEHYDILVCLGKLTSAGHNYCMMSNVGLPAYPFLKKRFPLYPDSEKRLNPHHGPVNHPYLKVNTDTHPTLAEHIIRGEPVWPAAGFLEMAMEFGATSLMNVSLRSILSLSAEAPVKVNIARNGAYWKVTSSIPAVRSGKDWEASNVTAYKPFHGDFAFNNYYLPSRIEEVILHQPSKAKYFPAHIYAHVTLHGWRPDAMCYDVVLVDDSGKRLFTLRGLEVIKHKISPRDAIPFPLHIVLQPAFNCIKKLVACTDDATLDSLINAVAKDEGRATSDTCTMYAASYGCDGEEQTKERDYLALYQPPPPNYPNFSLPFFSLADLFVLAVKDTLIGFPNLAVELWIPDTSAAVEFTLPFVVVRQVNQDVLKDAYFDVIVAFGGTDPHSLITKCDNILLPGGIFIVAEFLPSYHAGFDGPPVCHLTPWKRVLDKMDYSVLHYSSDSFQCTIEAQKAPWSTGNPNPFPLFNPSDAFIFDYKLGEELELQWHFSGLNPAQVLEIWILASEGADSAAGLGLTRALRREYLFWEIRFVSFPSSFGDEMRHQCLASLPFCLKSEPEILFSSLGEPLVPRLVPLVAFTQTHRTSSYSGFRAFVASALCPDVSGCQHGSFIVGLQHSASNSSIVDVGATSIVPMKIFSAVDHIAGVVVAVLGVGVSLWKRFHRLTSLRILITHSDNSIGASVCNIYLPSVYKRLYLRRGLKFSHIGQDATMLDLARMGQADFDVIISGYEDQTHIQLLQTLVCPSRGKIFLWHQEVMALLERDPCSIGDALRAAEDSVESLYQDLPSALVESVESVVHLDLPVDPRAIFDPDKTYVILGGIGSIGAHIAFFMTKRGARHIVVTSRSGAASLKTSRNLMAHRIFTYLKGLDSLDIRLEAVDATSSASTRKLFGSIPKAVGGCIILTAVLADGLFPVLGEEQFTSVFAAKSGVIRTLHESVDVTAMDFIVAFSSTSSIVGTGGQANHCAANSLLEEQMLSIPNGFSFVCPGILDSSLMLSGGNPGSEIRLKHLTEWSISTDELILWLDDAFSRYQTGSRFHRYIPNVDWEAMDRTHGMPKLGAHLVPSRTVTHQARSEPVADKASRVIRGVLGISEDDFDPEMPLTSYGIDSLSASRLSFALRSIIELTQFQLLADASLTDLMRKVPQSSPDPALNSGRSDLRVGKSASILMNELVEKYSSSMAHTHSELTTSADQPVLSGQAILLTGSTGALGCHILAQLLGKDQVQTIYALNRKSPDGVALVERQITAFKNQGLPHTLVQSAKLTLLEGELSDVNFGMPLATMNKLSSSVTHIIHNAWRVDFLAPLLHFDGLILGTHKFLEFAMKCSTPPSFSFISSIGKCFLRTNVIRVGLLAGSENGSWDTSHWLPALVQSGAHIGCLPDGDDVISWIPINDAAASIVDMQCAMNETLHLIHPRPTTWRAVVQPLASILGVPLVPYAEWFARLKSTAQFTSQSARGTRITAALKLLDFYRLGLKPGVNTECMGLLPKVASEKGLRASKTLRSLSPLIPADTAKWVEYWQRVGFLHPKSV
ncbi:hypothetical protein B0H17DRAFT_1265163 [Mycena rosella]|uniref:Ketosynthase family 3 (KS3) domain-containing protein n=2 Tax=Mycena rosella TaxID=1033263 RepID=A0AAD7G111_MYCRO|nr:hypothetical protein B0H17DRAFT_1265163 [Mycena rosella]